MWKETAPAPPPPIITGHGGSKNAAAMVAGRGARIRDYRNAPILRWHAPDGFRIIQVPTYLPTYGLTGRSI